MLGFLTPSTSRSSSTLLRRLILLCAPLALLLSFASGPGRAQTTTDRWAFADTTLLRDTLNLSFARLFPLADSLQVTPDSLRAWSIRLRFPLERLVWLADSLAMPIDSVGPLLLRERFNPLGAGAQTVNSFTYTTTYTLTRTTDSWVNGADVNLVRGPLFFRNTTNITLDEYGSGTRRNLQQTRASQNEAGWKFSPNLSVGGRANLDRFDTRSPGASGESETKAEYQVSVRTRQQLRQGLTSELNFFGGALDVNNVSLTKTGLLHDLNGRVRFASGWLTHDLQGQINGNASASNAPGSEVQVDTRDRSRNLRGTLGLFNTAPASVNVNYTLRDVRVQVPAPPESLARGIPVTEIVTGERGVDLAFRLRRDNDRFLNVTQRFSNREQASSVNVTQQNMRDQADFGLTGRWAYARATLDASFSLAKIESRFPRRSETGGYTEDLFSRSISATLNWRLSPVILLKSTGSVSLSSSRFVVVDLYSPPADRDSYRQSYRNEVLYNRSEQFSTAAGFEVGRVRSINLPAASTASNNEIRTYRADWRWSYRLSRGLTATQRNQLTADYTLFRISDNNRLLLDYSTYTTLNAVLTSRLQLDINHSARFQPSGNWVRLEDGIEYLRRADENETYTLDARMSYSPLPGVALNLRPQYVANDRNGTVQGVSVPQRRSRLLTFAGGASLDLAVGGSGQLSGDVSRNFRADQSTLYTAGVPRVSPVSEDDFWSGSLQFRWQL